MFYYRVIKNWLKVKASLVLHTRQLEDDGKTKTKRWAVRSQWRQSGWSPVGSPVVARQDLWWEGFVEQVWSELNVGQIFLTQPNPTHN